MCIIGLLLGVLLEIQNNRRYYCFVCSKRRKDKSVTINEKQRDVTITYQRRKQIIEVGWLTLLTPFSMPVRYLYLSIKGLQPPITNVTYEGYAGRGWSTGN